MPDDSIAYDLPYNLQAEKAVLGAMMVDNEAPSLAMDILTPEDFYLGPHRQIFNAMISLVGKHEPVDLLTVSQEIENAPDGLPALLRELLTEVTSAANIEYHARIIRDNAVRRSLVKQAASVIKYAGDRNIELDEVVAAAERSYLAASTRMTSGGPVSSHSLIIKVLHDIDFGIIPQGIHTGFVDIDKMTRGLHPGTFNILAGLPSQGKSSLALNITLSAAERGEPVGVALLEGTHEEYVRRAISCLAETELWTGDYQNDESASKINAAANKLDTLPIIVDETAGQTPQSISSRARMSIKSHGVKLLVVDYLQLISVPRAEGIFDRVSEISMSMKNLAKELNIPILALSQFNREGSKADRPTIWQLKGGSQLEQDADTIMIIHESQLHLDKNKNGPCGSIPLFWEKKCYRFKNGTSMGQIEHQTWRNLGES